jgi:hypothetical protein
MLTAICTPAASGAATFTQNGKIVPGASLTVGTDPVSVKLNK